MKARTFAGPVGAGLVGTVLGTVGLPWAMRTTLRHLGLRDMYGLSADQGIPTAKELISAKGADKVENEGPEVAG
jgi:hypothetical protein